MLHLLLSMGKSVYVHCTAGINRATLTVVGYLTFVKGWQLEDAKGHVKARRPQAHPYIDCWQVPVTRPVTRLHHARHHVHATRARGRHRNAVHGCPGAKTRALRTPAASIPLAGPPWAPVALQSMRVWLAHPPWAPIALQSVRGQMPEPGSSLFGPRPAAVGAGADAGAWLIPLGPLSCCSWCGCGRRNPLAPCCAAVGAGADAGGAHRGADMC